MDIETVQRDTVTILRLQGPLAGDAVEAFETAVDRGLERGQTRLVLDLEEVPFIDSRAIETLQDVTTKIGRAGGDLRLAALNDVCFDIMLATRMQRFLRVCDNVSEAERSLR